MCAIFGIVGEATMPMLMRMADALRHRGPDRDSYFESKGAMIGHCRLSITAQSDGDQPFISSDKRFVCVVNGEIYNFRILKQELVQRGVKFSTSSDCEVLLHGYRLEGRDFFSKINGIFAFAIWDQQKEELLLGRDHVGVKPLYLSESNGRYIFASEIKGILATGLIRAELDTDSLADFLFYRYVNSQATFFRGIKKLLPGEMIIIGNGKLEKFSMPWGKPVITSPIAPGRRHALASLLSDVTKDQLMGEVDYGLYLSGGLDSSTVSAFAKINHTENLKSFCVDFQEYQDHSERTFAKEVAEHFRLDHYNYSVSEADLLENFGKIAWHYDEPAGDGAVVPTYLVSKYARSLGCKVIFAGEGSDELFAGYEKYQRMITGVASGELHNHDLRAIQWEREIAVFDRVSLKELMPSAQHQIARIEHKIYEDVSFRSTDADTVINQLLLADQCSMLSENYLMKADKMSMAHGIEERVPFLDQRVVKFARGLSWADLSIDIYGKQSEKAMLKDSVISLLPQTIINRKKKGYGTPTADWFRGDIGTLFEARLKRSSVLQQLNMPFIENLLRDHKAGTAKNNTKLWSLFALDVWFELYIDNNEQLKHENYSNWVV